MLLMFFLFNPPLGWNVVEAEKLLRSWRHIGWRNTKICIHGASWMEQKHGKCWKLPIFEGKLQVFISYLSEMKIVSMFYNFFIPALFTCFYHFLFWIYLNSSMTWFSSDTLLPFPNSNGLNSHELSSLIFLVWYHEVGWVFSARQVCLYAKFYLQF